MKKKHSFWTKPRFKSVDEYSGEYDMLSIKDIGMLVMIFIIVFVPIVGALLFDSLFKCSP